MRDYQQSVTVLHGLTLLDIGQTVPNGVRHRACFSPTRDPRVFMLFTAESVVSLHRLCTVLASLGTVFGHPLPSVLKEAVVERQPTHTFYLIYTLNQVRLRPTSDSVLGLT